jgi:hypothetical protein
VESFARTTPDYRLLFIADSDDEEELRAIDDQGAECMTLDPPVNWARKINAGYHATTEPFFFIGADDIEPQQHWYERAIRLMKPGIGIVGTNDQANRRTMRGQHSTHMLVRRAYIEEHSGVMDEPNTVVCEEYPHEYADDELVQTAMARGAYAHAFDSIVKHFHPIVGGLAEDDDTYRLGRSQTRLGHYIFRHRQKLWQT